MKIAILTFHRATNYGALLQTYALQNAISTYSDVEVLDYKCNQIEYNHKPFAFKKIIHIRSFMKNLIKGNVLVPSKSQFKKFVKDNLVLSPITYTKKTVSKSAKDYDMFLVGSDQVWNLNVNGGDHTFFLDFTSKKKASYAASVGTRDLEDVSLLKKYLSQFDYISVREKNTKDKLSDILENEVHVSVDPTLLLSYKLWESLAIKSKLSYKKYVLVYNIIEDDLIFETAFKIAKENDIDVIYINDTLSKIKGAINLRRISLYDFLYLFLNATFVITNSFHGLMFSIKFNKNFYIKYLPEPSKVNSRIEDYLKRFNLENRVLTKSIINYQEVNYSEINPIIDKEMNTSIQYLQKITRI